MNDYTPDERALKAELDSLANSIHADSDFVATLQATLMQHEAMHSIGIYKQPSISPRVKAVLAAAVMIMVIGTAIIAALLLSQGDECDERCLVAFPMVATNWSIATSVRASETALSIQATAYEGTSVAAIATSTAGFAQLSQATVDTVNTYVAATVTQQNHHATASQDTAYSIGTEVAMSVATVTANSYQVPTLAPTQAVARMTGTPMPNVAIVATGQLQQGQVVPPLVEQAAVSEAEPDDNMANLPAPTMMAALPTQEIAALTTFLPTGTATPSGTPSETPTPSATPTGTLAPPTPTPQPTATRDIAPEDMPPDMFFENYGVNPMLDTEDDALSTFAMDVDTASYTITRNYLNQGTLPPPDAIRSEEFINYFDMNYPAPAEDAFGIYLDAAPAPFGYENHYLMRVGIQGRYIPADQRQPALLIFVIDVSGSMDMENRLGTVKQALALLVKELREDDRVGIAVYSDNSRIVLPPTPASEKETIMGAINALHPEGSTNAEAGLRLGYGMAAEHQRPNQLTRVILLSDGVANNGITDPQAILDNVRTYTERGITLSTIGFGMGNYNDILMEQLANDGDGNYFYVDTLREARRVFVYNLTGTLQVIGYDAKVQVEFNPEITDRYRLIGYENRAVADADFRNDSIDAGEVGAGHSITALYELALENPDVQGKIATVYIRYQDAETREVVELSKDITTADLLPSIDEAPATFKLAAAVAEFSELLRESYWAEDGSYADLLMFAAPLEDDFSGNEDVTELLTLIRLAGRYVDR